MARIDTLGNFLTDVATAIRNKKGTTDTIVASNFDTEIESIETGGSSNGIKFEFQTYTPIEDEITHTFTHNLGAVPDIIMIYHGCMPSFYSKQSTETTLISAWGLKQNSTIFSNGQSRYARSFYCVSQNANSNEYGRCGINFDDGIDSTSTPFLLKNATSDSFMFDGSKINSAHLGKELTYYIILISGVNE